MPCISDLGKFGLRMHLIHPSGGRSASGEFWDTLTRPRGYWVDQNLIDIFESGNTNFFVTF